MKHPSKSLISFRKDVCLFDLVNGKQVRSCRNGQLSNHTQSVPWQNLPEAVNHYLVYILSPFAYDGYV